MLASFFHRDPRRHMQNIFSQQCSYCFNNNRPRYAQQTRPTSNKQEKQKSDVKVQPSSTHPNTITPKRQDSTRRDSETNEQCDSQQSKSQTHKTFEEDVDQVLALGLDLPPE
ncbi:hypothetical protein ElyMa_004418000 [Elysia marginata]|uniref:Uncharacterized protein n=1 Tax=Elysia marginata TaxID=1093978 RepID=A0AAV4HD74_9GAST|nr:hypothetical protein ElyMa_004418000 [Elysia marginata]